MDSKDINNEVLIFSSPCLLKLLSNDCWFVDATFKIAAKGYRQLLIIIVYHAIAQCYLPATYILMTHKNILSYRVAFSSLSSLCQELGLTIQPTYIMCDFEAALRSGIRYAFPKAKIAGCYFHYSKAIWHYMASNGLTSKERLHETIKLVTFFKILAHIEIADRKEVFEELTKIFKEKDQRYSKSLDYFKRNWLTTYYVESMKINQEEDFNLINRTNNVCENYNYKLNQKLKITNPRLSILVSYLLDEEFSIREFITKSALNIAVDPPIPNSFAVREDELPIGAITRLLEEKKRADNRYPLKSKLYEKEFLLKVQGLVENCYRIMFMSSLNNSDQEENMENQEESKEENQSQEFDENYTSRYFSTLEKEKEDFENVDCEIEPQNSEASASIKKR